MLHSSTASQDQPEGRFARTSAGLHRDGEGAALHRRRGWGSTIWKLSLHNICPRGHEEAQWAQGLVAACWHRIKPVDPASHGTQPQQGQQEVPRCGHRPCATLPAARKLPSGLQMSILI